MQEGQREEWNMNEEQDMQRDREREYGGEKICGKETEVGGRSRRTRI